MDPIIASSKVSEVVVFRNKALVTRNAVIESPSFDKGRCTVFAQDLPLGLEESTLRVNTGDRAGDLKILSLEVGLQFPEITLPHKTELEQQLWEAQQDEKKLIMKRSRLQTRFASLSRIKPVYYSIPELPDSDFKPNTELVGSITRFSTFVSEQVRKFQTEVSETGREIKKVVERIKDLRAKYNRESSEQQRKLRRPRKQAIIVFESSSNDSFDFTMSYLLPWAAWFPWYEFQFAGNEEKGVLKMGATVAQDTGENWRDVKLILSTADLTRSSALPELDSWRIGRGKREVKKAWKDLPENLEVLFEDYEKNKSSGPSWIMPPEIACPIIYSYFKLGNHPTRQVVGIAFQFPAFPDLIEGHTRPLRQ